MRQRLKFKFLALLLVAVFLLYTRNASRNPAQEAGNISQFPAWNDSVAIDASQPIAFLGDPQRTSFWETFFLRREQNDEEREKIVHYLSQENYALLVFLGDFVFSGGSQQKWADFDALMQPIYKKNKPALFALGNHEYYSGPESMNAFPFLQQRFPALQGQRWYLKRYGTLALLFLDTNFSHLSRDDLNKEIVWYEKSLAELQKDPSVQGILVLSHQPPYSNADNIEANDDTEIQKIFLPSFYQTPKAILYLSGHAHGYQHIIENGKNFIVSAGGGGPRFPLLPKEQRKHLDVFDGNPLRPFHYVLLWVQQKGIRLQTRGFDKGTSGLQVLEEWTIHFPEE